MQEFARLSSQVLEALSFVVILFGVAVATAVFLVRVWRDGFEVHYRDYRANLGRGILIGLELLIAADILKSVVIDPTLQSMLVLGGIVIIRTFLSISLDVEINGHWPWETTKLALAQQNAQPHDDAGPSER